MNASGPGGVKTLKATARAQQKNRKYGRGESFVRQTGATRINIARNFPKNSFDTAWVKSDGRAPSA